MIKSVISKTMSFLKELQIERFLVVVLFGILLLTNNTNLSPDQAPIGERIGEQLHQTSKSTERPKTTGEFLDEARGNVPLDERLKNITRDSKEAFQQFGEGITTSAKEGVKELTNNVTDIGK